MQQGTVCDWGKSRLKEFALVAVLVIIAGFPSLFFPFGRDQGIHAYVGGSWLQGRLPFRDIWVQKGPLAFAPHVLVTALFGRTMWGIRLFDLVWQIGCSWLLYIIARPRINRRGALISVGLYVLTYFGLGHWYTAHIESFLSPLLLLGVFFYERAGNSRRPLLLQSTSLIVPLGILKCTFGWQHQSIRWLLCSASRSFCWAMISCRRTFSWVGSCPWPCTGRHTHRPR